ncbi:MAG: WD40 repeat domain-containing protein [Chitinophagaceae bacterium]|nr:WD40 repeat domain-containing protein [Chitinophagaceae bacterium]
MHKLILSLLFLFFSLSSNAQIWYFGFNAGIKFISGSTSSFTTPQGNTNSNEGCAVANDVNGNILFYTDGVSVWNRTNSVMLDDNNQPVQSGNGLDGNVSATQAAIIVPKPKAKNCRDCKCDTFYIFTVSSGQGAVHGIGTPAGGYDPSLFAYGLRFTTVVFDANHLNGYIPSATKNLPLITCVSEKLTAIYDATTNSYWVLAHGYDPHDGFNIPPSSSPNHTKRFLCYKVTAAGVTTVPLAGNAPALSTPQEPTNIFTNANTQANGENAVGQMKFSPDGKLVALGVYTDRYVEVFDFSINTGLLSNPKKFQFPGSPAGFIYGLEFSPDSKQLFVGGNSSVNNSVYQINIGLINLNIPNFTNPNILSFSSQYITQIIPPPITNASVPDYGEFQLGPDGKIYIGRRIPIVINSTAYHLSVIPTPINYPASIVPNGIQLSGITQGAWSLPTVVVNALKTTCPIDSSKDCSTCKTALGSASIALGNSTAYPTYNLQGIQLNFTALTSLQQVTVSIADLSYSWDKKDCKNCNIDAISGGCLFPATANQSMGNLVWNNQFNIVLPPGANNNECPGQLQWDLGNPLAPGTYSTPMNLSLPVSNVPRDCKLIINKLCVRVTYKDINCNVCDTLICL